MMNSSVKHIAHKDTKAEFPMTQHSFENLKARYTRQMHCKKEERFKADYFTVSCYHSYR